MRTNVLDRLRRLANENDLGVGAGELTVESVSKPELCPLRELLAGKSPGVGSSGSASSAGRGADSRSTCDDDMVYAISLQS
jgi:hypothetical protein